MRFCASRLAQIKNYFLFRNLDRREGMFDFETVFSLPSGSK